MGATTTKLLVNSEFKMPNRSKVYARKPAPVRAIQMQVEFDVALGSGINFAGVPGDYLLSWADGSYSVMKKDLFESNYEEVIIGRR